MCKFLFEGGKRIKRNFKILSALIVLTVFQGILFTGCQSESKNNSQQYEYELVTDNHNSDRKNKNKDEEDITGDEDSIKLVNQVTSPDGSISLKIPEGWKAKDANLDRGLWYVTNNKSEDDNVTIIVSNDDYILSDENIKAAKAVIKNCIIYTNNENTDN